MNIRSIAIALALLLAPSGAFASAPPTTLFASEEPISLTLTGPVTAVSRGQKGAREAVLTLRSPAAETLPVRLSPRGVTRLKRDVCQFAPMRVEFVAPPPPGSLFEGQRRLKLVTHCRAAEAFQQHLLLEYAAYKLHNQLTPASYRVRLASIDYVDEGGRPVTSRLGFFIEDIRDVAARNGTSSPRVGEVIATSLLDSADAARVALFQYMIGNLDWSTRAGPPGDRCCHNSRLIGPATGPLVPVPYDFDFSGLVSAPYATPPDSIPVRNVRVRHYGGYCLHNPAVPAVAAEVAAKRSQLIGVFSQIPHLEERTRARGAAYIDSFFADIADQQALSRKLLRTCID
jgi:hypothetical protein